MVAVGGTPDRYSLRRSATSPHHHQREPPKLGEKAICGRLWVTLFSELCKTWSPSNVQKVICSTWLLNLSNDSLVSHKERWATHWGDINQTFVYRFLGTSFLRPSGPLIQARHLRTEWTLCIHYNMRCTIRETTSLGNLFQPLFYDKMAWLWWLYRFMATFGIL